MKLYFLCIFIYFAVSPSVSNPTFADTTWQPAFDITTGNTKSWTWSTTENYIDTLATPEPKPTCDFLRPVSCLMNLVEKMKKKGKQKVTDKLFG